MAQRRIGLLLLCVGKHTTDSVQKPWLSGVLKFVKYLENFDSSKYMMTDVVILPSYGFSYMSLVICECGHASKFGVPFT